MTDKLTRAELREAVARAIDPAAWSKEAPWQFRGIKPKGTPLPEINAAWWDGNAANRKESLRLADAALAVAREYYARIADGYAGDEVVNVGHEIAGAIRRDEGPK